MDLVIVKDIKPGDNSKTIEVKVYRKWISKNPPEPTPTAYCCILLDKLGSAIQANMNYDDMQYFNEVLELDSAYRVTNYICEQTKSWQRTLPTQTTLKFGKFTRFESIPANDFPNHHFNFVSYNLLSSRLAKNSILTDYIGCIRAVGEIQTKDDPNRRQFIRRVIDLENLNGNMVQLTMWDEMASAFDDVAYDRMPKPIILAISSCRVTRYKDLQLSSTPASHYYFNPDIQEVNQSMEQYKVRYNLDPPLPINRQKYDDKEKEKSRNRIPLATLNKQNPNYYKNVRFTCEATVVEVDTQREWYLHTCKICHKKLTICNDIIDCKDHGQQSEPEHRFNFRAIIKDNSSTAAFIFFSPVADIITKIKCSNLVKELGTPNPHQIPPSIAKKELSNSY